MRDILAELERWQAEGEEIAVATLVSAWGSAPRRPGARFAVTRSGRIAGSVSGGCVEGDVFARAMEVLDAGHPRLLRYGISDEMAFGVGLSCGGTIEVFVEPFRADAAWNAALDALATRRPCALATAVAPDELAGRRIAVTAGAPAAGGIAPSLDGIVAGRALAASTDDEARLIAVATGGVNARVLVEGLPPPPRLVIIGATHVAAALCRQAKALGFAVSIIDARRAFATPERFPEADELIAGWPEDALGEGALDAHAYLVILTHDIKFDIPALAAGLRSDARYIGVMGGRSTLALRMTRLREMGFDDRALARVHAPIGLDLGGRAPEEIALAIAAEITAVRYGRPATAAAPGSGEEARDEAAAV
jgi:xanthine dehydrogenase accessory factor